MCRDPETGLRRYCETQMVHDSHTQRSYMQRHAATMPWKRSDSSNAGYHAHHLLLYDVICMLQVCAGSGLSPTILSCQLGLSLLNATPSSASKGLLPVARTVSWLVNTGVMMQDLHTFNWIGTNKISSKGISSLGNRHRPGQTIMDFLDSCEKIIRFS